MADKKIKRDWPWIPLAALCVSLSAFALTLYTSYLGREYLRRSQRPRMQASYFYNDEGSGFMFGNVGVGPAYLSWFQIQVDGVPQSDWRAMGGPLGLKSPPHFEFNRPGPVYRVDSYTKHFWISPGDLDNEFREQNKRVNLVACYCSLFDEYWIVERFNNTPRSVSNCSPKPNIHYGGDD